jgi:hypothetical protein
MNIINDLRQLIRDNYDKIAAMPKKSDNTDIRASDVYIMIYYKDKGDKIIIFSHTPNIDEFTSSIPFNEQLWTDFYNELKEAINA